MYSHYDLYIDSANDEHWNRKMNTFPYSIFYSRSK